MEELRGPWTWAVLLSLSLGPGGWLAWLLPFLYFVVILLGQGAIVLLAYQMPSLDRSEVKDPATWVAVSVIIPARNEANDLARCLDDLAAQDYPRRGGRLEVIVVDGASTDGTPQLARRHPSVPRVIPEPPLPSGWVGKNWACHLGAQQATGELLLFLDADVRLAPEAVRAAVAHQQSTGANLVTFATRIVMKGFWERVVMPLYVQFVLLYFLTPRVNRDDSSRAMANGQFSLYDRKGYELCGGHERVKGAVLEDVRLAQELKRAGGRIRILWTPELAQTRMYADRKEMAEGILKNLHGTKFSGARQVGLALALFVYFLSPFLVLALWIVGLLPFLWGAAALLLILLTMAKQVAFQGAIDAPKAYGTLYPVGCVYYLGLFARSLRRGWGSAEVSWKGRSYRMDEPGGGPG